MRRVLEVDRSGTGLRRLLRAAAPIVFGAVLAGCDGLVGAKFDYEVGSGGSHAAGGGSVGVGGVGGTCSPACEAACNTRPLVGFYASDPALPDELGQDFFQDLALSPCGDVAVLGSSFDNVDVPYAANAELFLARSVAGEKAVEGLRYGIQLPKEGKLLVPASVAFAAGGRDVVFAVTATGTIGGTGLAHDAENAPTGYVVRLGLEGDPLEASPVWSRVLEPTGTGASVGISDLTRAPSGANSTATTYVTGQHVGAIAFDDGSMAEPLAPVPEGDGTTNAFIVGFDESGRAVSRAALRSGAESEVPTSIAADARTVVVGGVYSGDELRFADPGATPKAPSMRAFGFVAALDRGAGTMPVRWAFGFGTPEPATRAPEDFNAAVFDVALLPDGDVLAVGSAGRITSPVLDAPCSALQQESEALDAFVMRLDRGSGACEWARALRGEGTQLATSVAVDAQGVVWVGGVYERAPRTDNGPVAGLLTAPAGIWRGFLLAYPTEDAAPIAHSFSAWGPAPLVRVGVAVDGAHMAFGFSAAGEQQLQGERLGPDDGTANVFFAKRSRDLASWP